MTARSTWRGAALFVLMMGCSPPSPEPPAEGTAPGPNHEEQAVAPSNRIELSPTVRRNLGITFTPVEARRVAQTIRIPGAFELQPLARHEYRMALSGRVKLLVDQYQEVEVGQPLYRYQSPAWPELVHEIIMGDQALDTAVSEIEVGKAKVAEARRKLELVQERIDALARAEFKRADLAAQAAELEASLPRQEAELRLAETRLRNAHRIRKHAMHRAVTAAGIPERQLEAEADGQEPWYMTVDEIEVRAVESGVVEMLAVTDGAYVEPPNPVMSTVDPSRVRFRALALQGDLSELSGSTEARIVPPQSPGISLDAAVTATMMLGLEAHPDQRTVTLLATPEELAPWIRPGVSAFLEVEVDSTAGPALAIPRSAIVRDGLTHVFFRRDPADPNRVLRVEADMGPSDGRWVAIQSGLMRGDQVVLDGVYELKLAMDSSGTGPGSGHFHADGTFHGEN